jgi:hypothetical protein
VPLSTQIETPTAVRRVASRREVDAMTPKVASFSASVLLLLPSFVLAFGTLALPRAQETTARPTGSLADLTFKTGWIPLGETTEDLKQWAVGSDPNVDFTTGTYEIVGSDWDRRKPRLPRVGARIRLVVSVPVYILDYQTAGEKRRLEPLSSATRPLGSDDYTGIRLPAGTIVEVRAVEASRRYRIRTLWARVVPVSDLIPAPQTGESAAHAHCIVRLQIPNYPPIAHSLNSSAVVRVVIELGSGGSVQSQRFEVIAEPRNLKLFQPAIQRAMNASDFRQTCEGHTLRFTFRFRLSAADEVWFEPPATYEITALPLLINTENPKR